MSNGDILDKIDSKIERALEDQRLGKSSRATLEVQSLFVAFFRSSQEDHKKIEKMYPWHKVYVAVAGLLGFEVFALMWGLLTDKFHIVSGAG